jgi:hypothetical protein
MLVDSAPQLRRNLFDKMQIEMDFSSPGLGAATEFHVGTTTLLYKMILTHSLLLAGNSLPIFGTPGLTS